MDLLTPLVKSFASDEAFRLAGVAIQVYGGAGYLKDHPVEQYARDAKIYSIYEGTNHIQAMDLVGRKMGQAGGANFQAFLQDVAGFVEAHRGDATLGKAVELLAAGAGGPDVERDDPARLEPVRRARAHRTVGEPLPDDDVAGGGGLDAARCGRGGAEGARRRRARPSRTKAFYAGKVQSALWFARNVLPQVEASARSLATEDASPLDIPDAALGTR